LHIYERTKSPRNLFLTLHLPDPELHTDKDQFRYLLLFRQNFMLHTDSRNIMLLVDIPHKKTFMEVVPEHINQLDQDINVNF
jgi:hypothetical protein